MAKVVLIKNLADFEPSVANLIMSSMIGGDTGIEKYDPDKVYNSGDKVYIIENGQIIIKECINSGVSDLDDRNWITVDSGIGGASDTQNPNSYQNISYFENKLVTDIGILTERINSIISLGDDDLSNTHTVPMYTEDEVVLTKGKYEFGRIFI